jgi:hypothetical protein
LPIQRRRNKNATTTTKTLNCARQIHVSAPQFHIFLVVCRDVDIFGNVDDNYVVSWNLNDYTATDDGGKKQKQPSQSQECIFFFLSVASPFLDNMISVRNGRDDNYATRFEPKLFLVSTAVLPINQTMVLSKVCLSSNCFSTTIAKSSSN